MDEQTPETTPPQDQPEQQATPQPEPQPQPPPQQPAYAAPPPPPPPPPYRPVYPPQTTPKPKQSYWWIPVSLAIGCLPWLLLGFIMIIGLVAAGGGGEPMGKHVALIRVSGVITGGGSSHDFFGGSTSGSEDIIYQLERARKNDRAKAIVIRVDSPGGSAAASEEVWDEIMRVRRSKPVYTSMGDVAASGGYYIACACDRIYADHNTLTGSIGVIFSLADMSELYRKIGYRPEVVKSGKYKDIGSAARPLTADERVLLQNIINDVYNKFIDSVAEGRRMKPEQIKPIADGRLFTGSQAVKLKLVDEIGGLRAATRAAAKRAGITGEPDVVEYKRKGLFDVLMSSSSEATANRLQDEAARRMVEEILRRGRDIEGIR